VRTLRQLRASIGTLMSARRNRTDLTELAAVIAWESQRARLNQGLGVRPSGFSDGEFCLRPEPLVDPAHGLGERTS
jgi:hypothetical protein